MRIEVGTRRLDHPEAVGCRFVARGTPRRDAVTTQYHPNSVRVVLIDRCDVEAQLESGATPGDPGNPGAKDVSSQSFAVCRCRDGNGAVGMQMVDMRGLDQAVHRSVDGWRGPTPAVQAKVKRRHHLVLPSLSGIDGDQRSQPVEAQDGQPGFGQRAEIATGALDPHEINIFVRDGVALTSLRRGVAAGEICVPPVCPEAMRSLKQLCGDGVHAPHPTCSPPTLSAMICWRTHLLDRQPSGPPASRSGTPFGQGWPDVRIEGIHQRVIRSDDVAGPFRSGQALSVDQESPSSHLLDVQHGPNLRGIFASMLWHWSSMK